MICAFRVYVREISYDQVFDYHSICTASWVYAQKVMIERALKYCKLTLVTQHYNIEHNTHQAMGDVEATVAVLQMLFDEQRATSQIINYLRNVPELGKNVAQALPNPMVARLLNAR